MFQQKDTGTDRLGSAILSPGGAVCWLIAGFLAVSPMPWKNWVLAGLMAFGAWL